MDNSPARFVAQEVREGIDEMHDGQAKLCDGRHSTHVVGFVEYVMSIKPGKPLTRPQRQAVYERVAQVCRQCGCPGYQVPAQVLWQLAADLTPRPRRKRPDSGG